MNGSPFRILLGLFLASEDAMKNLIIDHFILDVEEGILETMPWDKMDKHVQ